MNIIMSQRSKRQLQIAFFVCFFQSKTQIYSVFYYVRRKEKEENSHIGKASNVFLLVLINQLIIMSR